MWANSWYAVCSAHLAQSGHHTVVIKAPVALINTRVKKVINRNWWKSMYHGSWACFTILTNGIPGIFILNTRLAEAKPHHKGWFILNTTLSYGRGVNVMACSLTCTSHKCNYTSCGRQETRLVDLFFFIFKIPPLKTTGVQHLSRPAHTKYTNIRIGSKQRETSHCEPFN